MRSPSLRGTSQSHRGHSSDERRSKADKMKRIRMEGEGKGGGKGVCVGKCSWMMDAYTDVDGLAHKKTEKRTVMQTDKQTSSR